MRKLLFTLILNLFTILVIAQVDFKNDGISIKHIDKLQFKLNTYPGNNINQLEAIINEDVFNFFDKVDFGKEVDTELKQKFFMQTTKYFTLKDSLLKIKSDVKKALLIAKFNAKLSNYSLNRNSFSLDIPDILPYDKNSDNYLWEINSFSLNLLPLFIKNIYGNVGVLELIVKDEVLALKMEENRNNIKTIIVGNIISTIYSSNLYKTIFIPDFLRLILYNETNNEIYFDNVITESGIKNFQVKDFTSDKVKVELPKNMNTGKGLRETERRSIDSLQRIENARIAEQRRIAEIRRQDSLKKGAELARINQINSRARKVFGESSGYGEDINSNSNYFENIPLNESEIQNSVDGSLRNSVTKTDSENESRTVLGRGNGVAFSLSGRMAKTLPKPSYPGIDEGIVVVEVSIDKYGRVIKAVPGISGTTTKNSALIEAAKSAALKTTFDSCIDAPEIQIGTITYRFVLD